MTRRRFGSKLFAVTTGIAAGGPLVVMLVLMGVLVRDAWPAWRFQGLSFFSGTVWNMGNMYANTPIVRAGVQGAPGASFGILPLVVGTLYSSLIALAVGVPIALLTAAALVYLAPKRVSMWLSPVIDLLAGIPSVVYGLWGVEVLAPFVQSRLGPWLSHVLRIAPFFHGPVGTGMGLLTSGLVLAVMIIPIVTATTRELLAQVPRLPYEGAQALGLTSYESVRYVAFPWVSSGVIGAVILGWGRALGETMAVLMVSGNAANYLPTNIYSPISTMASTVAALLDSALTDFTGLAVHALALIAVTLLAITMATNLLARSLVALGRRGLEAEGERR